MGQEIKIPVSAQTGGAQRSAEDLADAFNEVAAAVSGIGGATQTANRGLADLLRRARETRAMLSRELREPISAGDTTQFMRNFAGMQPRSSSLRGFQTEQDWYRGHTSLFKDASAAETHRRRVLTFGMQGTGYSAGRSPPPSSPPESSGSGGGSGGGGSGGGSAFQSGLARAQNSGLGFGKSMLALAGIGSVMGMATRAADLATEDATGTDTLKRRLGDLGVDFEKLRTQMRTASVGLGVTYVETTRLGQAYAREVGNLGAGDNVSGRLRTGIGFSRSYGLDPNEGTQFFGQMARFGAGRDEAGQRRLALLIGDAVAKSGYTGKVDELLQAVADYTSIGARMMLQTPNVEAYANALTSLTGRGLPGLDPAGAAALIGTADGSMRRGGAMGEASMNFMYAAMRNASPGIKPVDALALMEGGLFGTTRGTFGGGSPLAGFMGKGVGLNDRTNLEKVIPMFRKFYGNNGYMLDAVKNSFGLSSHAQAAALVGMQDRGQLGASAAVMGRAGIDPMALNASGFATVGAIANAKGRSGLQGVYGNIMGRGDLSDAEKKKFADSVGETMKGGSDDAVRTAMVKAVSGLYQEKTPGSETRQAITDLTNKLTESGGPLLSVLNPIRDAVVAIADRIIPGGYLDTTGGRNIGTSPWAGGNQGVGKAGNAQRSAMEKSMMAYYTGHGRSKVQAAAIVGAAVEESNLDPLAIGDGGRARGIFQMHPDRWNPFVKWAKGKGLDPNSLDAQMRYFDEETKGGEIAAGNMLKGAKTTQEAAAAMVRYERPGGYNWQLGNYQDANDWTGRLAQTQRLASDQPATAPVAKVEGSVDVHVNHPDGRRETHRVPLKPVAAPKAAGRMTYPTGGNHSLFGAPH